MSDASCCFFDGCDKPRKGSQQYCSAHCQQLVRGGPLRAITRESQLGKQCSFEGCVRGVKAKRFCGPHYQQHLAGGELKPLRQQNEGRECRTPGCVSAAVTKGFCHNHYTFQRRLDPKILARERSNSRARYAKKPEAQKDRQLKCNYGISLDDYNRMLEEQGGVCGMCGEPETAVLHGKVISLAVDHDHDHDWAHTATQAGCPECIRELLCRECNVFLGKVGESEGKLTAVINYLQKHRGRSA